MSDWFSNEGKKERMQKKAILCVIGIGLLFLAACVLLLTKQHQLSEIEENKPVVERFANVYIVEVTDTYITFFDGETRQFPYSKEDETEEGGADLSYVDQIADITVTDGIASSIVIKNGAKQNGKVVGVESGVGVELENSVFLPFAEEVNFFILYGEMRLGASSDIRIGYNFADFVIEDGKICAVLLTRDESMDYIRVQIKNGDDSSGYHEKVEFTCDSAFVLRYTIEEEAENGIAVMQSREETYAAGDVVTITAESSYFVDAAEGSRVTIIPAVLTGKILLNSVTRSQGTPSYRGTMEIVYKEEGLAVINELLLEEYLYGVVPSEMPSWYPLEALKAQAICARTYAYSHMLHPGIPTLGAHVDDSTAYQVYNNMLEQSTTTTAVKETAGQLLYADGTLVNTYYYSTSCGFGSDEHAWKSENALELSYLSAQSISREGVEGKESIYTAQTMQEEAMFSQFLDYPPETDFEKEEPWYRWTYDVPQISEEKILAQLQSRYRVNNKLILTLVDGEYRSIEPEKLGDIKDIFVLTRKEGGAADEIIIEGSEGSYKVISELNIRYVLCDGTTQVVRQDGSLVDMTSLLPSAFFIISPIKEGENMVGYHMYGGGFGHGAGMSQNGAKNMAQEGFTAEQIVSFFYRGSVVEKAE